MQTHWRGRILAVVLCGLSLTATHATAQNAVPPKSDDYFNYIELNVYGGWATTSSNVASPSRNSKAAG